MKGMEHRGITSVDGPVIIVKRSENSFYGEIVAVFRKSVSDAL